MRSFYVLNKTSHVESNTVFNTIACFDRISNFHPIRKSKVYSFCYIEAMVESCMVTRATSYHKFSFFMNTFCHSNSFFWKKTRIYQSCFMSNKFGALSWLFRKFRLNKHLELLTAIYVNAVPKFRLSIVKIIDRI